MKALQDEGFTYIESQWGINESNVDWNQLAVNYIEYELKYGEEYSVDMVGTLSNYTWFTDAELIYALNELGVN